MVVGYGELELTFAHCAGLALGQTYEVLNAIQSVRSESARIKIADALSSGAYKKLALEPQYADALGGLRHCLKIRNQYAHSQYSRAGRRLKFFNPNNTFTSPTKPLPYRWISIPMLKEQAAFFGWTRDMLIYLQLSIPHHLKGKLSPYPLPKRTKAQLPPLHK